MDEIGGNDYLATANVIPLASESTPRNAKNRNPCTAHLSSIKLAVEYSERPSDRNPQKPLAKRWVQSAARTRVAAIGPLSWLPEDPKPAS